VTDEDDMQPLKGCAWMLVLYAAVGVVGLLAWWLLRSL